jgi:hypothetical protein
MHQRFRLACIPTQQTTTSPSTAASNLLVLIILDSYGRIVREFNTINSASPLRLDGLASGVYSVRANFVNGSVVKALLVN